MKILIVGGGIGGLALAGYLRDSNFDYQIIEKHQDWKHEGYSLGLWGNARLMLKKLDLADEFDEYARPFHFLDIRDGTGKMLKHYNLSKFNCETGMAFAHMRRSDLHELLLSRVDESHIKKGVTIVSIQKDISEKLQVVLSDGSSELYDLVVGADGIHSKVREVLFAPHVEEYSNWRVWWLWSERNTASLSTATEYLEPGMFAMVFDEIDKVLVILATRCDHTLWDDAEGRVERLKKILLNHHISIPLALDKIKSEEILPTDLAVVKLKRWTLKNAVLIGDAAHALEPFSGMGASMALEDAYVLAAQLIQLPHDLSKALIKYEHIRYARIKKVQKLTSRMRGWMVIESPIVRKIINYFIPIIPESIFVNSYMDLLKKEF